MTREELRHQCDRTMEAFLGHLDAGGRLAILKAPPGSGKTHTLMRGVVQCVRRGQRVAVGTQTNSQADDLCRRLALEFPSVPVVRFASADSEPRALGASVQWVTSGANLPPTPGVVVATVAKWAFVKQFDPFEVLFVDEAWQMAWADFMPCGRVAGRFVLIGDPGQIPPVVPIPAHRWETSPRAPYQPAPELILLEEGLADLSLTQPACRRLPYDAVSLVQPFYDFGFAAWATPGSRFVRCASGGRSALYRALNALAEVSVVGVTLTTPSGGPSLELDPEVAEEAARVVVRLLERDASVCAEDDGKVVPLRPADLGMTSTHRVMNHALWQALPSRIRSEVRVDTPERWQGLERKVMVVVHPLAGVVHPSAFDLETGRLCVMASRHQTGMVLVTTAHLGETLRPQIPSVEQAVRRADVTGRGSKCTPRLRTLSHSDPSDQNSFDRPCTTRISPCNRETRSQLETH